MLGLALLLAFYFMGVALHDYARVPLPENVLGMLLLLVALGVRVVKVESVQGMADLLLRHMMLFFVPVIVAVMPLYPVLAENWLPAGGGLVLSTLATLAAAACCCQWALRKGGGHG